MKVKGRILNPRTDELKREFNEQIVKDLTKISTIEPNKDYLNLRDNLKPSYGVNFSEGKDVFVKGPAYI